MFNGFTSSQPLDLSGFNTALVESFSGIFSYSNMPSVNITNWQTSQYTLPSTTSRVTHGITLQLEIYIVTLPLEVS